MKKKTQKTFVGLVILIVFLAVVAYLFVFLRPSEEIPFYVTGETREVYEWAKTPEGSAILEQIPCNCGCKYQGHLHARHCFWKDDGTFDKHGITCSICIDIGIRAKQMHEEGKDICEIRKEIDRIYAPHAELATPTPMPEGCE